MPNISYEEVAAHTGATMVGGDLILGVGHEARSLGRKHGTHFVFTPEGHAIAETLAAEPEVEAEPVKRTRKPKAGDGGTEVVEPANLELALTDEAGVEEQLG